MNKGGIMKKFTLEELTNKHIGEVGTPNRERFDFELRTDVIGEIIKKARLEQNMTQEQLGQMIGVQKSQISKIENNTKDVRFSTILRVFDALKAHVNLSVELPSQQKFNIA
jgi:HTH-type transcriptional regulator/antitoxin HipB